MTLSYRLSAVRRRDTFTDDGQLTTLRGDLRPIAATLNKSLKRQPVWRLLGQAGLAFAKNG